MTSGAGFNDWRDLREFRGVALNESFVLSWRLNGQSLLLDIDLSLLPSHVFYESPRPAERACYRPALLEFPACTILRRCGNGDDAQAGSAFAASLGHGKISDLRRVADGRYVISGRFGDIEIASERPVLSIKETMT